MPLRAANMRGCFEVAFDPKVTAQLPPVEVEEDIPQQIQNPPHKKHLAVGLWHAKKNEISEKAHVVYAGERASEVPVKQHEYKPNCKKHCCGVHHEEAGISKT
jgi:hypothetical protein